MATIIRTLLFTLVLTVSGGISLHSAQAQHTDGVQLEINKGTILRLPGEASVVAVSDPAIADIEVITPSVVSVQGRGVGQTSVIAFTESGDEILNETVTVTHNLTTLNKLFASVMPESDIRFDSVDGAMVMTGTAASPLEVDTIQRLAQPFIGSDVLVNMLDVEGSDQVMLQVKIAEVSRNELKRFGINLSTVVSQGGDFAFGLVTGRSISGSSVANIVRNADDYSAQLDYNGSSDVSISSVIDALAEDNLIKVLAEPNLTTASGRSSNFLAGGEFPIPVPGDDGQVTIEWREFGVGLEFTPNVLSKERISLTVAPEVSELSQIGAVELQGFNIPSLSTRRAETTVELGSGQSFAIAGLLQSDTSNNVSKFPGLGDLPILGALFRSNEFRNEQTELVIIVTPYIVRGIDNKDIALPTDEYVPPSDPERILLGRPNHPDPDIQPVESEGTPRDLRKPDYRRKLGRKVQEERTKAKPAPTASRSAPVEQVRSVPVASAETSPAPKPVVPQSANLNGPVGFMLR